MAAMTVAAHAIPAAAQDTGGTPAYGEIDLSSGFTPDPYSVNLQSGGSVAASELGSSCSGFIANNPDFRLRYSSGSLPLIISVASDADTTLVINAPDGRWYCNDDGGEGLNPSLRFEKPMSGRYEIWVGTYSDSSFETATLQISELVSE
ncbi:peptidase S1 [Alteraurantiacibacter aquimixticola]|uniref:Peptidase S1 n=2 Tax=Alteraurantiacibacter aquimixticola TaxID=2489173 RepID=A0A4T3F5H4_9SPHN|nr:peptidase S1 [Alteraurantiacibacter aquimixticola]